VALADHETSSPEPAAGTDASYAPGLAPMRPTLPVPGRIRTADPARGQPDRRPGCAGESPERVAAPAVGAAARTGSLTQTVCHLLLAYRTWELLQQHEALITEPVMSAYATVVDVIGQFRRW
jgi:hypothetical protein